MLFNSKKYIKLIFITVLFIITVFFIKIILNKLENNLVKIEEPITINLLTSVHPNLPWGFKAVESKILVLPGEVKTIEYFVENLSNVPSTGIATFAYFPKQFGNHIRKLNCFCYDAQPLKPKHKDNY